MKKLAVYPKKNNLSEIKTWIHADGFELIGTEDWRDGLIDVFFPENKKEEEEMLNEIYADSSGRRYPGLITLDSVDIDLSDYVHEVRQTSLGSYSWKVLKKHKKSTVDDSENFSDLISKLENMDNDDIESYLEENEWELDLQYFFVKSIMKIE